MGILEGDERRKHCNSNQKNPNADSYDAATQEFDSQFSPGGASEGDRADDILNIMNTMPFDDTYLMEDAFESQMANLAAETQVVDLAGETQVLDLYEESQMEDLYEQTQMVDLYGETQMVDLPGETQVLDEFNAELGDVTECGQTNKTDVMGDTQRLSEEDDSAKTDGSDPVKLESTVDKDPPKEESPFRGFTSIRAASIRASGLAAHARVARRDLSTTNSDKSSLEQQSSDLDGEHMSKSGRKSDQEFIENGYNYESERKLNQYKIASTAVRKLFGEDEDAEAGKSETETNQAEGNLDMPELPASEYSLAGLSYANSQEPGELSQAHALEVVDRFLDLSFLEDDEGFGKRVHNVEKPKAVSAAKGSRDLAKKTTLQTSIGECGIYDWNDAREDDGGGEFFLKKKELFFDNEGPKQRCLTEPQKSKSVRDSVDKKEKQCTKTKLGDLLYSDSGLLHKAGSKQKSLHSGEEVPRKNLIKNLDEQLHEVPGPELSDNGADKDILDVRNIGPDTQMAAEAMGDLCFEVHLADSNNSGDKGVNCTGKAARQNNLRNRAVHSEEHLPYPSSVGVVTRQAKRTKRISTSDNSLPSLSPNQCSITKKRHDRVLGEAKQRRLAAVNVSTDHGTESLGQRLEKCYKEDQLGFSVPVAHRTRKSTKLNCSKVAASSVNNRDAINDVMSAPASRKRTAARDKNAITMTIEEIRKVGLSRLKQSNRTCVDTPSTSDIKAVGNLQGERSRQETLADIRHSERLKISSEVATSIPMNADNDNSNHPSPCVDSVSRKISSRKIANGISRREAAPCNSGHLNVKSTLDDAAGTTTSKKGDEKSYHETSAEGAERNGRQEATPRSRKSSSACATPASRTTLGYDVSPICMGDEYHKQSCRRNLSALSLMREIDNLHTGSPEPYHGVRESRKRKDITNIRVLFSQHLDDDVVKKQKKILSRLGGALASSMLDATHFVADEFVRTRNMLEAIASGKPVVTCLWIESCGQASCLIDERNYILRDAKKEKEFGFSLPVSLARACQHPLLQGQKVLVTPNTKPCKDILANLVKAVHGLPIERLGRSAYKDEKLPDDILILSCEEDYDACIPFLEKGADIYSSELLLNGIVKQKLEYERHLLFADHVKRTRSTIWLKKRNKFLPVTK